MPESLVGYEDSSPLTEVAVIGAGSTSVIVSGLTKGEHAVENVTAIVNPFDDGGATGELRNVYPGLIAVGDLGQSYQAMSQHEEDVLALIAGRYPEGNASHRLNVEGQNPRNLLIAKALLQAHRDGYPPSHALKQIASLFQIKGNVVPASYDVRTLRFSLPNGRVIYGEHNAEETKISSFKGATIAFNEKPADISEEAEAAIRSADMVVISPGDLYTSIGPNLVVRGMREALQAADLVVLISNLWNRKEHTAGFTTLDYLQEYTRLLGANVVRHVVVNTEDLDPVTLADQARRGNTPVQPDIKGLQQAGYVVQSGDLLSRAIVTPDPYDALRDTRTLLGHNSERIARILHEIHSSELQLVA